MQISENFYFDLNTDTTRNMVKAYLGQPDLYTLAHSAIFSLTYPSSDVFLVIKLEKVLQSGDVSVEAYMKDKDTTKVKLFFYVRCYLWFVDYNHIILKIKF